VKLNAKLEVYLQDPKNTLDLSGINFSANGAKRVSEVLPKW
jgi:hypothetical protein